MTAQLTPVAPAAFDLTGTPAVPFTRLARVELRKMADTRAGRWLLASIAATTALVLAIQLAVVVVQDLSASWRDFVIGANTPMGVLLPILGIMSVTSEWSQRTAMVTFSLEPSRSRVLAAKAVSVVAVAVAAVVLGLILSIGATALFGVLSDQTPVWEVSAFAVGCFLLLHLLGMALGFAFGTLFLNSAVGIVVYFVYSLVLPPLFALGAAFIGWFSDVQPWVDFNAAQNPLIATSVSGTEWAHLATSGLIWLVLPLAVGLWRVLRAEVK